jgi:hypothetical protein
MHRDMPLNNDLENSVSKVEQRLGALGQALCANSIECVENEASELQRALVTAVEHLGRAARAGEVAPQLRQRLALASGRVAAQRESLARATAALDRAIDVLMPAHAQRVAYSSSGIPERSSFGGVIQA